MARLFRKSLPVNVNDTKPCVYMRVSVCVCIYKTTKNIYKYIYIYIFTISRKKQVDLTWEAKKKGGEGGKKHAESATIKNDRKSVPETLRYPLYRNS
mgnify:CR=1 FL=1